MIASRPMDNCLYTLYTFNRERHETVTVLKVRSNDFFFLPVSLSSYTWRALSRIQYSYLGHPRCKYSKALPASSPGVDRGSDQLVGERVDGVVDHGQRPDRVGHEAEHRLADDGAAGREEAPADAAGPVGDRVEHAPRPAQLAPRPARLHDKGRIYYTLHIRPARKAVTPL